MVKVASAVYNSDHINAAGTRRIEDQVVLKTPDWHLSHFRELRHITFVKCPHSRLLDQKQAGLVNGGEVSFRH